ncbi:hypothetical protein KAW43_03590 [Candidatus Parcubacteria bacterium]|nr:hypothetical protein [Candidatus Parcubacteria bacterium]
MNKTILISLSIIAAVGVIAVGGTIAFQSDFEKSESGTFAMGILDLKIDSDCHFNGMDCTGGTWDDTGIACACKWDARDLIDEKFFNFIGLKSGDFGEATISMHVTGDDAYVRFKIDNIENYDNGCNVPECVVEGGTWNPATQTCTGTTCGNPGSDVSGELGANMDFAIWFDMGSQWGYGQLDDLEEGDNILNGVELGTLVYGTGNDSAGDWVELKDPTTGIYIPFGENKTYYIGVAWCVGTMPNVATGDLTCDGSSAGNIIQSDSYVSDSIFEVVQATHNDPTDPFSGI